QQTVLRFIDTNYGTLLTDEYVVGGAGFIATVDRGNLHYICFEENSVAISGDPHGNLNVEQSDFLFRYDSDDNLLYTVDGEWYACREEDAVVVNVESNEDFTPYVGFHDPKISKTTPPRLPRASPTIISSSTSSATNGPTATAFIT
ncbi:MAG: hypothetical protein IKX98_07260, partial [Clostridia bacterium]|nr:hypothetical protein [Clostridia bacterium]